MLELTNFTKDQISDATNIMTPWQNLGNERAKAVGEFLIEMDGMPYLNTEIYNVKDNEGRTITNTVETSVWIRN